MNSGTVNGTLTNTAANTIVASGSVAITGTFNGTVTNSTIHMTGTGTTLYATAQLGNLNIDPGAPNTISLSTHALSLAGNLLVSTGTLDMSGNSITMNGTANLSGTITNSGAATFTANGAITLTGATAITSNNGNILFNSTLDGTKTLGLTAGAGSVKFGLAVGSVSALGAITISSALNVWGTWWRGPMRERSRRRV